MNLSIGTKIRWEPSCGLMIGSIKNIVEAPNAKNEVVRWIDVEYSYYHKAANAFLKNTTRLCATDSNLKMMRVLPLGE